MELEWNYNETSGARASGKTSDIGVELRETVTKIMRKTGGDHNMDLVSQNIKRFSKP